MDFYSQQTFKRETNIEKNNVYKNLPGFKILSSGRYVGTFLFLM